MSSLRAAEKALENLNGTEAKNEAEQNDEKAIDASPFQLRPVIPDAVYFCSIEPPSQSHQLDLDRALAQLQREDPSLRVRYDEVTAQTVLGGMGELHLEIIKSRILSEYKIDVDLGPLQIAYKETILESARELFHMKKEIGGSMQEVQIDVSVVSDKVELFNLSSVPEEKHALSMIRPKFLSIVRKAAPVALQRGPIVGGEVENAQIILHSLVLARGTAEPFLISSTIHAVQKLLHKAGCRLLEPIMTMQIITPGNCASQVMSDLARRRAEILEVTVRGENRVINVNAPLAELSGYSTTLRTMTSGTSSMTMQPCGYSLLSPQDEQTAIRRTQGLE